jgi:tRNA A37 methylthiotransferase MiaB
LTALAEELTAQRAEDRVGQTVDVLVESIDGATVEGRAEHQAPEVDGSVEVRGLTAPVIGEIVSAVVTASDGVDLVAEAR